MTINTDKFVAANQAAVDSLLSVVNAALASAERIATLNLNAARSTVEDTAAAAKTVLAAKDPQAALAAQSALVQPAVEKAVAYSKSLYEISNEAQQELTKMFEAQFGEFQKAAASLVEQATKNAPAGSEAIVAAVKDAVAKANAAFGTASALSKQFTEATQATVAAATKATTAAAKKAK